MTVVHREDRALHRKVRERWVIEGTLELTGPSHFGNGEGDDWTDMPILTDETNGNPLLLGTSIAGALRDYLRTWQFGDGIALPARPTTDDTRAAERYHQEQRQERESASTLLFGGYRGDDEGAQSPLVVYDAVSTGAEVELRDGVAIDGTTRTAADKQKYDMFLLAEGTEFPLCFELEAWNEHPNWNQPYEDYRKQLLGALACALDGFSAGAIVLGTRKRRGFGQAVVKSWRLTHYDLTTKDGLLAWLVRERGAGWHDVQPGERHGATVAELVSDWASPPTGDGLARRATLAATFTIEDSLLIRAGFGEADMGPDMIHLHSRRGKNKVPVIPGTSWAGVLRHRATKIVNTLAGHPSPLSDSGKEMVAGIVNALFGPAKIDSGNVASASRISIRESEIQHPVSVKSAPSGNPPTVEPLVQTRVRIDRFTGGALESALFSQQPVFADADTRVELHLTLRPPASPSLVEPPAVIEAYEIGLLLLLLKDLWTGDLPVGGESGIGRGRLRGKHATLTYAGTVWRFEQNRADDPLRITQTQGAPVELQPFVAAVKDKIQALLLGVTP